MRFLISITWIAAFLLTCAFGCSRDEIRSYPAPKDPPPLTRLPASHPPMGSEAPSGEEGVKWTLPAGWEERPGSGMRYATLLPDPSDEKFELRVTPLALTAGDPLANVNRWRDQIALEPISAGELGSVMRSIEVDGRTAQLVNLVGPATADQPSRQILAAILPGDRHAWFFMLLAPADRVGGHVDQFEQFMGSVQLVGGGAQQTAATAESRTRAGEELAWETPEGWKEGPPSSQFRVVEFKVAGNGGTAEVAVTRFPGNVGGILPNINRWRGQIGLEPISDMDRQRIDPLEVDGIPAGLIDITSPSADAGEPERMLVVLVEREGMTWFIKMTGPESLLETEKAKFTAFVHTIRFGGDSDG